MASSAKSRKRTSTEASTPPQGLNVECRVCLQYVCCENQCCDIFDPWNENPEATIASYFTQVTNIQVSPSDRYTKYICFKCLALLRDCVLFIEKAQCTETELQKRYELPIENYSESLWPKPIQVDKCLSNDSKIEIEVKQEVLSEEDVPAMETDNEDMKMDIKVEPEEYASYDSPQIMDTISITPVIEDETTNNSDINRYEDENYLEEHVKEEPLSDNDSEVTPDLPLDCMLCTKVFHSVSGLKAHVIAQHSYLTIARKPEVTPRVYECFTCRRTFLTHTDLIVHESCHGEYACYMCNSKFETFLLLTKHRKRCRNNGEHVSRLKTLEDVKRPSPDPQNTKTADSTNTEQESQEMDSTKTEDSMNTELQKMHEENAADSINIEESRKMHHLQSIDSTNTESQPLHHGKTAHLLNTELQSQKTCQAKTADSTELESQKIHYSKAGDLTNTGSKAANPTNTKSQSQKIHNAKLADSINFKTKSQKIEDSINTESQPLNNDKTVVTYILGDCQSGAAVETIYDNSSRDSNSSKSNNPVTEENKHNSVNNTNSELNNSNSVLSNPNSEITNLNCESIDQIKDLETQTPMDDSHIEISTESEDFNLTFNDTNEDLNSPVPETNIKKSLSSDLSQSLNTNSTCLKFVSSSDEVVFHDVNVFNNDHVSASKNVAEWNKLAMDSVSDSGNSISKNSNLESDKTESVVEINNVTKSQIECANISLEVSQYSKENTNLVAESDSMKIHLAIHSLEKKSLDNLNVQVDEDMVETKESNEDKVLQ